MELSNTGAHFERRPCRGEVFVYNLSGGPAFKADLIDLGRGGASIALDRPLAGGTDGSAGVSAQERGNGRSGRVIVGHVVHSRAEAGRHVDRRRFRMARGRQGRLTAPLPENRPEVVRPFLENAQLNSHRARKR